MARRMEGICSAPASELAGGPEARVRPTCEAILTESPEALRKEMDPEAGIALIKV